ncbi:MAG: putative (cyclohexanone) monooxygenase [Acidimicrobiia bacterium]
MRRTVPCRYPPAVTENTNTTDVDVVVVGAGFAGLYALHHLRGLGYSAVVLEKGSGVGGTWFWNRYPGARCDVPSLEYSYGFDEALQQEWEWSEVFPPQDELERYLNHVADRFDLRGDIRLSTCVTAATYDEAASCWTVETEGGDRITARYVVMATGCLSVPMVPDFPGLDSFGGQVIQTSMWPSDGVDLAGKRVGLIGTGSSGVQATPELADMAGHLYVFQRTATYTWPSHNGPLDPEVQRETKARYTELRAGQRANPGGVTGRTGAIVVRAADERTILDATEQERRAVLEELEWDASRVWSDAMTNPEANELAAEMYREMVRRTVDDPETAESLSPRGFPIHCKRPVIDTHYFATFNRDDVTLVDLRKGTIEAITETGIQTAQGHFDLDVIIFATGFDAMTGALLAIDIRGRDGRTLRDAWAEGPNTLLGLQVAGFPNLFTVTGPGSPSVLANMVVGIEHHIEWIGACLAYLRDHGYTTIEATEEAQAEWGDHVRAVAQGTMFVAPTCNSWYVGANIPGKPRVFLPYVGGLDRYIAQADAVVESGYEGFALT